MHLFSGSSVANKIKSFNRANNHKRLQLCALLKFFDKVIQSYFFFPVYKHLRHCTQTGVHLNYGKNAQSPSAGDSSHIYTTLLKLAFKEIEGPHISNWYTIVVNCYSFYHIAFKPSFQFCELESRANVILVQVRRFTCSTGYKLSFKVRTFMQPRTHHRSTKLPLQCSEVTI